MLRLYYFGALLGVAAILSAPICAQTPAASGARIQHVVVRGTGAAMEVEIQTSGAPVEPDTQAITGPDRIVVDFPGALPAAELRALKVNRGALKAVRTGLFFDNPPITRVVLDLAEPQSYRVSTSQNAVVIKLGSATAGEQASDAAPTARLQNASLATGTSVATARVSAAVSNTPLPSAVSEAPPPPKPAVTVTFENGMLRIHAEKATLAQVLFEVQRQTRAEIAIPAGAELEQVVADLGPAPARDVLGALLNGSAYNFIFVGEELALERVILTRRDPNIF
ncbi:MAG: AMIN domain-containing protein [Terriglobales bacterium]